MCSSDLQVAIVQTQGNPDCHVILRGGKSPNYDEAHVAAACKELEAAGLAPRLMVDCSHANSGKDPNRQPEVWKSILRQRREGNLHLIGAMLESHLQSGSQPLGPDPAGLKYGVSITDACMDWETTAALFKD